MNLNERQEIVGLCMECIHHKAIVSKHQSTFHYCTRSETDPHYQKYPRLPVIQCKGFETSGDSR